MGGMLVNVFVRYDQQAAVVNAAREVLGARYDAEPLHDLNQTLQAMLPGNVQIELGEIFSQLGRGKDADRDAILFLVSPSVNGWVGVHDSLMQNQDEFLCSDTAKEMSGLLNTVAISFLIHDGDFLCYWLAKDGAVIDEYNSMPGYFEHGPQGCEPSGGDGELLAEVCGVPNKSAELKTLLLHPDADAFGQLASLGRSLGIEDATIDYNRLTYSPPNQIGFTVPKLEPNVAHRDQYVTITKKDLSA